MRIKLMDVIIESTNKWVDACSFDGLTFRKFGSTKVGIAQHPECVEQLPYIFCHLGYPGATVKIFRVKLLSMCVFLNGT
jgi:hypothetical protein